MKFITSLMRRVSVRGLVLLGFFMALLPLLMGLFSSILAVEDLAVQSQKVVYHVAEEAQNSQELLERLNELELKGKHYLAMRDSGSFKEYRLNHEQFGEQLRKLMETAKTGQGRIVEVLEDLAKKEKFIFDSVVSQYPPQQLSFSRLGSQQSGQAVGGSDEKIQQQAADWFQGIKARAGDMAYEYSDHVDREARDLEALSLGVKYRLIVQAAVLLPISMVLLTIFVYVLHQPLRQMDHVIRTLGAGNFTYPIRVYGPRDLEFLGERLEWLRTRLNDLEMAKQRFMRNVSHEIKTPLATIHEGTDLLLDEVVGELNQEQRDIAGILASSTKKLDALIVELINYSQLNARMEYQKFVLVDMRQLVSSLIEEYQLQFRSKSITTAESLEAVEIMGSPEQLHTMVDNLLSNAIKYSPPGGEIRIGLRKEGGHMELEIEDDGPGIDPDERTHVFEPFFQGRAAREFGVKGTGFGLAIVAECVASHHGKVEVLESAGDDAGARIRVRLPIP